jgi:hypothetical protein
VRRLIVLVSVAAMTLLGLVAIGGSALAKSPGPNGQIVFSRFNPDTGNADIFVANPDGTHAHEVPLPPGLRRSLGMSGSSVGDPESCEGPGGVAGVMP